MPRYLHGNDRLKERAIQNRVQARVANASAFDFERRIMGAFEEAAKEYKQWQSDVVVESVLANHNEAMRQGVEATWTRSGQLAGDRTLNAAKSAHGQIWVMKNERGVFNDIFQAYIMGEAVVRAVGLGLTTMLAIRQIIARGKERGDSVDDIADAMLNQGAVNSKYRAMMIARTESHAAYNAGRQAASEASDLQMSKEWVSANDGRTRDFGDGPFSHRAADGETVVLSQMFTQTGESLRFPGDPRGSAANVIHCRCGTVDVLN